VQPVYLEQTVGHAHDAKDWADLLSTSHLAS
jgi:hypothetical protein